MVSIAVFTSIFINPPFLFGMGWIPGGGGRGVKGMVSKRLLWDRAYK